MGLNSATNPVCHMLFSQPSSWAFYAQPRIHRIPSAPNHTEVHGNRTSCDSPPPPSDCASKSHSQKADGRRSRYSLYNRYMWNLRIDFWVYHRRFPTMPDTPSETSGAYHNCTSNHLLHWIAYSEGIEWRTSPGYPKQPMMRRTRTNTDCCWKSCWTDPGECKWNNRRWTPDPYVRWDNRWNQSHSSASWCHSTGLRPSSPWNWNRM